MTEERIFPFLWMREGDTGCIEEEIHKIYDTGARALCVESRPHEGFCGESWWRDMDIVMRTAEKLGMKVWLLDDKNFPTGYANAIIEKKYPQLRQWHICENATDVAGPMPGAKILLYSDREHANEESLLCVVAFPRRGDKTDWSRGQDITACAEGDFLYWDVPAGLWTVVAVSKTRAGSVHPAYIDMMEPKSVDALIEAVYEPHYEHYGAQFGKTFAGFFSDEPRIGNGMYVNPFDPPNGYNYTLGIEGMAYPWNDAFYGALAGRVEGFAPSMLTALWFDIGEKTAEIRGAFMEEVTDAYSRNFVQKLGDWCRARGVLYSGHIIEDMGAHTRLGFSAGHYFKSMRGADIAGIDVVLHQIRPEFPEYTHRISLGGGFSDATFFNYTLAKLASSDAHIDPAKQGRALCEIFGAYGWNESVRTMKWLADHMLVRGVNYFIPHAFSMRYPDADCPPHFYARGNNPAYRAFCKLTRYMLDVIGALEGKKQVITAAVLYHADAEWSGRPYMPCDVACKALAQSQIDFDIVPAYALEEETNGGKLHAGAAEYSCLVVPACAYLPHTLLQKLEKIASRVPVFYLGTRPPFAGAVAVSPARLGNTLQARGLYDVRAEKRAKHLRVLHAEGGGEHLLMLFNEGGEKIKTRLEVPFAHSYRDYFDNNAPYLALENGKLPVELEAGHAALYSLCDLPGERAQKTVYETVSEPQTFRLSARAAGEADFAFVKEIAAGTDVNGRGEMPAFSGELLFETAFAGGSALGIEFSGELCAVYVDGEPVAESIVSPFRAELPALSAGEHKLEICISNMLVYRNRDFLSRYAAIPKTSLDRVQVFNKKT